MTLDDFTPTTEPECSFFLALVQIWREQGRPDDRHCLFEFGDLLKRVELPNTPQNRQRLHDWLLSFSGKTTYALIRDDDPYTTSPP